MSEAMKAYLSLEEKVECLDAQCTAAKINVIIGNSIGELILWTVDAGIGSKSPDPSDSSAQSVILETNSPISGVAFNGNGTKVASCDEAGIFRVIYISDHQMGTVIFQKELTSTFTCLNWSLSETQVLVGDTQGLIHVWDVRIGQKSLQCEAHTGPIWCISRTHDKIITAVVILRAKCASKSGM